MRLTEPAIRVVLADDAVLIRAGIARLLEEDGFEVVAQVGDYQTLIDAAQLHHPDLVITDIRMPPTMTDEGLRAAATLRKEQPSIAVMVLSQHIEATAATSLLTGNPTSVGYLLKERAGDLDEFAAACRAVAAGATVIDPIVTERLLQRRRTSTALDRLTEREREVLDLMAQGKSNSAIARTLYCADKTLEAHIRSIFTKLDLTEQPDANRRVAAVIRWLAAT